MNREFSVYFDNNKTVDQNSSGYLFLNPVHLVIAKNADEIDEAFSQIRQYLSDGYHVAGWISYETGLLLEDKLTSSATDTYEVPFIYFGVYEAPVLLSPEDSEDYWAEAAQDAEYAIENIKLNISKAGYEKAVVRIHEYLKAGDIYQVNFTLKSQFDFIGSPESFFAALRRVQSVEYGAFMKTDKLSVLSLSPELFFKKTGRKIIVRPMKGTFARGRTVAEDNHNASFMMNDEKNRAENLMIVDLLRNDLARISSPASVKLKSLYDVEKYRTLFQMTSTIESEIQDDLDVVDIIKALFPCGSVTGAPKIRAMEIISQLEKGPRGIYTGAIGYMTPDGDCCFSVPIRTITIDDEGKGGMGIGSAIVADSDVSQEYDECLLKAEFATKYFRDFDLIESIRWSGNDSFYLLELHMERLKSSADYFDYACDELSILNELHSHTAFLDPDRQWKIRLLLSRTGGISIMSFLIEEHAEQKKREIKLSDNIVDSQNPMIFHKTTDRDFYDQEFNKHDSYDVIFVNEKGDLTEGTYNNIFLKQGNKFYTPPLSAGVLNGTLRQSLFNDPETELEEKQLTVNDLRTGDKIYMGNSVRGLVEVIF